MVFQAELIAGSEASPPARVTPTIRDAHSEGGDALRFQLFRDLMQRSPVALPCEGVLDNRWA